MKRGKDEEKIVGPMFPRLHVNDTEKGGPRAPPRNKMALYEQLSIPSQRFNPGVLPPNPNNTTNMVPPLASSSQASGHETGMFVQVQLPPSIHPTENRHSRYSDLNTSLVQLEQKKKLEEDDFRVPIFVRSEMGQDHSKNHNIMDKERLSPFIPAYSGRSPNLQNASVEEPKQTDATGFNSRQEARRQNEENSNEHIRGIDYRNSSIPMRDLHQQEQRSPDDTNGDDVSETSMVDSISAIDISPDDVVGIIGQKHFWKARKAIVNQQRVFAVQVFELHRLMKVQRLIAASPHILLEDDAYLGKTLKAPPAKKLPLEYIVKPTPTISKQKVVPEKPNHTIECSAENAIGKASLSSVQNGSPFSGNPTDSKMGSWGFNQPTGHQWLIPVMSPSEGLVYKPYPGPGFMGPVCGPPVSTPVMGNFLSYGISPFAPPPSHGYFPPYGMPVMNPPISGSTGEQINHFTGQGLHDHLSGGGANFNVPYKSVSDVVKLRSSKESELQVSTASSPSGRQGGPHVGPTADGRNALPLFPTSPAIQVHEPRDSGQATRVIKVVPHNARSATESVARIFRSIQEERKQNDSA